ncbi:MAG: ATP-binding protein, partial [Gammaproteobacteria bacterium]|nr:ATP-binding protein [Gammaproteobacteria bacterium]
AANRSKEVVQQLLSLSHKNDRNLELVNVNRQIEDEIAFLRSYIPSSIQLEVEILVEDTYIMIDLGEFRQILINLVSNAVHAMSNKGLLSITIDRLEIDHVPDKTDVNLAAGHYLRLTVKDTGRGISDEVMPHLFEPFYTTKDVGEGTGMGLALVYSMLEAYGGYAGVKSEPGDGAVFELYFPVIDEPLTLAAAEVTESQTRGEANTCCRVLFVDDEKLFAELGKALLTDLGYKVDISTSSKDALTRFSSCPDAYDLLITDQMMPDLLGTELSEAVLKIRPDMKIVLCTGFGVGIDRELALLKGINGYITKPFRQDQFRVEIEKVIDS